MTEKPHSLAHVLGINTRRLRGGYTLENVAAHAKNIGANWSAGSVSNIELGRSKCTVETLAVLSHSLTALRVLDGHDNDPVTLPDLLSSDTEIQLTEKFSVTTSELQQWLAGDNPATAFYSAEKIKRQAGTMKQAVNAVSENFQSLNLPKESVASLVAAENAGPVSPGEKRQAKKAGISVHELRAWAIHLWGKPFEERRDEIAGASSTPQKKGRVSRNLLEELQAAMDGHRGNN